MKTSDIATIPSDRVLIKKLGKPAVNRGLYVPENHRQHKSRKEVWYGEVMKFGLDTNASEAYNLKAGDIVGVEPVGQDCDTIETDEGECVFVPQEFVCLKDDGTIRKIYANTGERSHAVA